MNITELHKFCRMERMYDNALPPELAFVSEADSNLCDAFAREWVRDDGTYKTFLDSLQTIRQALAWGVGAKGAAMVGLVWNINNCPEIVNSARWFDHCADEIASWIGVYSK